MRVGRGMMVSRRHLRAPQQARFFCGAERAQERLADLEIKIA
jgi:hypothetical protein